MTGPIEEAVGDPAAPFRFPALPGRPKATAETLRAGELRDLVTVYSGLGSGRLVILGGPGAGKSAAAILTLLDALEHRRTLDDAERATAPVPILLTTHGWDPRHQRVEDWLAGRLADDYPVLRSREFGRDATARLLKGGHVAVFLDGLDEMELTVRSLAVDAINRDTTPLRLVVLTRGEGLTPAGTGHLFGAAALELSPVPPEDAAEYLKRCQTEPLPAPWSRLITRLREQPDSVLASALDTPLNLTLVRDAFPDPAEVDKLIVPDRFGTRGEVEGYLLDRLVRVAYQSRAGDLPAAHDPAGAKRVLGYLAARMNDQNTRDLAWWRMHLWTWPVVRILMVGLLGLVVGASVGALVFGPPGRYTVGGATGTLFGVGYGAGLGLLFGLLVGLVSEVREHGPSRAGLFGWLARWSAHLNVAVVLLLGLAVGIAVGNQGHPAFGVPAGLVAGLSAGRAATRVWPCTGGTHPRWTLRRLRVDVVSGCLAGLPVGLVYGVTKGATYGLAAGIVVAFGAGLMVGHARPSADKISAVSPDASWRRAHQHGVSFGLASGIPLGIVIGIANALAEGPLQGFVAGAGFGTLIGLAGMVSVSDTWRTTLVFLQLRWRHGVPLRGMDFLRDAHNREILRTVGPLYQFRHARLQDRLAEHHRSRAEERGQSENA